MWWSSYTTPVGSTHVDLVASHIGSGGCGETCTGFESGDPKAETGERQGGLPRGATDLEQRSRRLKPRDLEKTLVQRRWILRTRPLIQRCCSVEGRGKPFPIRSIRFHSAQHGVRPSVPVGVEPLGPQRGARDISVRRDQCLREQGQRAQHPKDQGSPPGGDAERSNVVGPRNEVTRSPSGPAAAPLIILLSTSDHFMIMLGALLIIFTALRGV